MTAARAQPKKVDLFVIGGGINGVGITRDAAGRGYSVMLAEMNDLASGTSSAATKLIHGGLRYLEQFEFRLVHEALGEREVLWASAPHIIWPLRFVLPHHKGLRPAPILRLGLFLYDHIGGRKRLPGTRTINLRRSRFGAPLKEAFRTGFVYSDCWVDDARLVVLNARDAADRGAEIVTRTRVKAVRQRASGWTVELDGADGRQLVHAGMVVNAAGPWVDVVLSGAFKRNDVHNVRLVKGSHVVVCRLFEHEDAYIFQNGDGRVIFAIPYEQDFTLIGTTDVDFTGDPVGAAISDAETDYLLAAASEYFAKPVTREQVVWTYAGVRPLFDDGAGEAQEATRDYVLELSGAADGPKLLNVFGGKLTTYRRLAEEALEQVEAVLGKRGRPWTKGATLPGGDFPMEDFDGEVRRISRGHGGLPPALRRRLVRLYGTKAREIIGAAKDPAGLGRHFGGDLYQAEVDYLVAHEWARSADDILWRRTKLGLRLDAEAKAALAEYMKERVS